ncbi:MAG TPA: hypothetical protein VGZ24_10720 [Chthoniobacterales bacterium]|jgi:ElaB/YqjD/DUF883 family membrane-anchored ribosome-binding protein|nr:hypothetical protein [Chthoniobacterales bacterium]
MMNPSGDEFKEDEPLTASMQTREEQTSSEAEGRLRRTAHKVSAAAGDTWAQTKEKAGMARQRTEFFLRENPVPTILGALAIGLAIGLAIRYSSSSDENEIEANPSLGNVHWGFLSLPFLWPFVKSLKEKYRDSAEVVKEGVDRARNIDIHRYTKPIRKRWKARTN